MFVAKLLVFFIILITVTDGYYVSLLNQCTYISRDLSDVELISSISFNKAVQIQFNSTIGKFIGFTEYWKLEAQFRNNNPETMRFQRNLEEGFRRHNGKLGYPAIADKLVKPKIKLRSVKMSGSIYPAALVCSAYDFYPQQIKVSWLRDGKEMTTDATSTEELANGDWYYQIHSHLEYTPKSGEKISCMVEHASFNKSMIIDWDSSIFEAERNKIAIGASGLVLGIIIAASGALYYKKTTTGILVSNQQCLMQCCVNCL